MSSFTPLVGASLLAAGAMHQGRDSGYIPGTTGQELDGCDLRAAELKDHHSRERIRSVVHGIFVAFAVIFVAVALVSACALPAGMPFWACIGAGFGSCIIAMLFLFAAEKFEYRNYHSNF